MSDHRSIPSSLAGHSRNVSTPVPRTATWTQGHSRNISLPGSAVERIAALSLTSNSPRPEAPIENPYPQIITRDGLQIAKTEGLGIPREEEPHEPLHLNLSLDWNDSSTTRRQVLLSRFGLSGKANHPESREFQSEYHAIKQAFLASAAWANFREVVLPKFKGQYIHNAVCLGIGSLYAYNERRPYAPTVFIMETIFQDPLFTPADVRLLNACGSKVVPDPLALAYIRPRTFLFGIRLPNDVVWKYVLRAKQPAVFLGNDVVGCRRRIMEDTFLQARALGKSRAHSKVEELHDMFQRSQSFISNHAAEKVPEVNVDGIAMFHNTSIHWPRAPPG
ncbi:hypothetical protein BDV97DRAFT_395098 [Delphinella strobiligena]|nr:hypothetical protein BDV97DRAFT_395098 [Delphinella strobiligena]